MSSILLTSACEVGTHTTSLPAWPTCGSNGAVADGAWAVTAAALTIKLSASSGRLMENSVRISDLPMSKCAIDGGRRDFRSRQAEMIPECTAIITSRHPGTQRKMPQPWLRRLRQTFLEGGGETARKFVHS